MPPAREVLERAAAAAVAELLLVLLDALDPAAAPAICRWALGTRNVAWQVGQRTSRPAWLSSADRDVWHTLHGKTSILTRS